MGDFRVSVITTILSLMIFKFLLHNFNYRVWGIFISMQRDIGKINKINRYILYFIGHILAISITINLILCLEFSNIESGLILGFFMAIVETCFTSDISKYAIIKDNEQC